MFGVVLLVVVCEGFGASGYFEEIIMFASEPEITMGAGDGPASQTTVVAEDGVVSGAIVVVGVWYMQVSELAAAVGVGDVSVSEPAAVGVGDVSVFETGCMSACCSVYENGSTEGMYWFNIAVNETVNVKIGKRYLKIFLIGTPDFVINS